MLTVTAYYYMYCDSNIIVFVHVLCCCSMYVGVRLVGFATTSAVAPGYPSDAPMLMKIYSMLREFGSMCTYTSDMHNMSGASLSVSAEVRLCRQIRLV